MDDQTQVNKLEVSGAGGGRSKPQQTVVQQTTVVQPTARQPVIAANNLKDGAEKIVKAVKG